MRELRARTGGETGPRTVQRSLVNTRLGEREKVSRPPGGKPPTGAAPRAHAAEPPRPGQFPASKDAPKHVHACNWANKHSPWSIWTWKKANPGSVTRRPYTCGSWRHPGPCARHAASVTFARMKEAMARPEYDPKGWVFLVLTLDRNGTYSGERPWRNQSEAYKDLSRLSRNLHTSLRRAETFALGLTPRLCRKGKRVKGKKRPLVMGMGESWAAVVECHRTGWPHMNELLYAPELAQQLRDEYAEARKLGLTHRQATLVRGELGERVTATGWGCQSTAEAVDSVDAVNGYITKLASAGEATCGELAKLCQSPMNAPPRFRRLRAAKGFLPAKHKDASITGTLVRVEPDVNRSSYGAMPLHNIKNDRDRAISEDCCKHEGERWELAQELKPLVKVFGSRNLDPPAVESFPLDVRHFSKWASQKYKHAPRIVQLPPKAR